MQSPDRVNATGTKAPRRAATEEMTLLYRLRAARGIRMNS
jgi:hypothetical protein